MVPGLAFYVTQNALRARAALASCVRASAYLTALSLLTIVVSVMPTLLDWAVLAAQVAMYVWAWLGFAGSSAGLTPRRASLAVAVACASGMLAILIGAVVPALIYYALAAPRG